MKKDIKKHEEKYIHIPYSFFKRLWILIPLFTTGLLSYLNFLLIISIGNVHKIWTLINSSNPEQEYYHISQLIIIYPIIGEYILIGLTFICLIALIRGGFDKLKRYDDEGLILWAIKGAIAGAIVVAIVWAIKGAIVWAIVGAIVGAIVVAIVWAIEGTIKEFK